MGFACKNENIKSVGLDLGPSCFQRSSQAPDKRVHTGKLFLYFSIKTYVVGTQKNRLNETVLLSTQTHV